MLHDVWYETADAYGNFGEAYTVLCDWCLTDRLEEEDRTQQPAGCIVFHLPCRKDGGRCFCCEKQE